jgi:hypothetical protein
MTLEVNVWGKKVGMSDLLYDFALGHLHHVENCSEALVVDKRSLFQNRRSSHENAKFSKTTFLLWRNVLELVQLLLPHLRLFARQCLW